MGVYGESSRQNDSLLKGSSSSLYAAPSIGSGGHEAWCGRMLGLIDIGSLLRAESDQGIISALGSVRSRRLSFDRNSPFDVGGRSVGQTMDGGRRYIQQL